MKVEIKFAKHIKKPRDIRRLMQLEDISNIILSCIDSGSKGMNIISYTGETIFTVRFK